MELTAAEALSPLLEVRPEGLFAPSFRAYIDPAAPVERAILSHAHSDHAVPGHGEVWATPETLALYRRRHPEWSGGACAFAYGEGPEEAGVSLRLVPSGHILGSAQLLFEGFGTSILYTGDFKRRASRTARPAEAPRAAVLLTESTFGLPVFRFPPQESLERRLVEACREAFSRSETPVVLAYALGKTQEAAAILAAAGIPTVLHGAAWKLLPEYAAAGIALPLSRAYESGPPAPGEALIVPPGCARTPIVQKLRTRRTIYLSGWALRAASRADFDAHVLLPFSDHADFDELLEHVGEVSPQIVVTTHGYARDLARILAARGRPAVALAESGDRPPEDA